MGSELERMVRGVDLCTGKKLSRRGFLRRVLGMGGVAVAALVLAACIPGDEEDDEEEDDEEGRLRRSRHGASSRCALCSRDRIEGVSSEGRAHLSEGLH